MSSNDFHQHLNMEEQVRPPPGQPPGTASSLGGQQQQSSVLTGSSISLCQLQLFLLNFFLEKSDFMKKSPAKITILWSQRLDSSFFGNVFEAWPQSGGIKRFQIMLNLI